MSRRSSLLFSGVFGQPDPWDIYNSATYQHPMVPYDVLIDPLSLPLHPLMQEKPVGTEEVLFGKASTNGLAINGKELEVNSVLACSVGYIMSLYPGKLTYMHVHVCDHYAQEVISLSLILSKYCCTAESQANEVFLFPVLPG